MLFFIIFISCIKEFEKIFKSKSGNNWIEAQTNFQQKAKKYKLIKAEEKLIKHTDLITKAFNEYEEKELPPSKLENKVKSLISLISNFKIMKHQMSDFYDIDDSYMSFGSLSKDTLLQASELLHQLQEVIEQKEKFNEESFILKDFNLVAEVFEKIYDKSNEFYQLIPHRNFQHEAIEVLDEISKVQKKFKMISNLLDFGLFFILFYFIFFLLNSFFFFFFRNCFQNYLRCLSQN